MKNLLLVEDDRYFLQLLSSILKKDFQVHEATGVTDVFGKIEIEQKGAKM